MKRLRKTILNLNQLEARETPATLVGTNTVTYQDVDGDNVTVTFTKQILSAGNVANVMKFSPAGVTGDNSVKQQLQKIDLTVATSATGTSVTVTSTAANGGDGFANVGYINSTNQPVGAVTIDGDLGQLDAGDENTLGVAVASFSVRSMGQFGLSTQAGGSFKSDIYGHMGPMVIKRDIVGARWDLTGLDDAKIASITIGGSIIGDSTSDSGNFSTSNGDIGPITIKGNLIGGTASAGDLELSGYLNAGRIGNLTIIGSFIAGTNSGAASFSRNGLIEVNDDIGSATIGNIIGNATNPAVISARGQAVKTTTDLAIGKLTVRGRVEFAQILGGVGSLPNADAQIGPVTVGGDWIASSLVAGAVAGNGFFGDSDDTKATADDTAIVSRIVSLTIGGQVLGTVGGTDHFGIVAENVGVVKVGGTTIPMTAGNDDLFVGATGDFKINEL